MTFFFNFICFKKNNAVLSQFGSLWYSVSACFHRAFARDVTAAVLVSQNNKIAAILVF